MRIVKIIPVLNGFRVEVGCQELVFNSIEKICEELIRYQKDPSGIEQEYVKNAVNKVQTVAPGMGPRNEVAGEQPEPPAVTRERNR